MTTATFSADGFRRGAWDGVPLAVSIFAHGLGFGLVLRSDVAAALLGVVVVAVLRWSGV